MYSVVNVLCFVVWHVVVIRTFSLEIGLSDRLKVWVVVVLVIVLSKIILLARLVWLVAKILIGYS